MLISHTMIGKVISSLFPLWSKWVCLSRINGPMRIKGIFSRDSLQKTKNSTLLKLTPMMCAFSSLFPFSTVIPRNGARWKRKCWFAFSCSATGCRRRKNQKPLSPRKFQFSAPPAPYFCSTISFRKSSKSTPKFVLLLQMFLSLQVMERESKRRRAAIRNLSKRNWKTIWMKPRNAS